MVSLRGVIPAHLLPFTADLEIDEPQLRRHVRALLDVDGVTGITTNAHASEVATLTADEQRRVLDIVLDEADGTVPVISGVYQDGSAKAARIAADAEAAGADALLVFPSVVFDGGSQLRPEMAFAHYAAIADATSLPMIAFIYPSTSGLRLGTDAVVRICSEIDNVVAVKEWSNDIVAYERNLRALRSLAKPISVLSSFSRSLLASLVLGADGVLSGHGSLVVDLHVELWRAVEKQDLARGPAHLGAHPAGGGGLLRRPVPRRPQPHEGGPGRAGTHRPGARTAAPAARGCRRARPDPRRRRAWRNCPWLTSSTPSSSAESRCATGPCSPR